MHVIFYWLIFIPVNNYIFYIKDANNVFNAATKSKKVKKSILTKDNTGAIFIIVLLRMYL